MKQWSDRGISGAKYLLVGMLLVLCTEPSKPSQAASRNARTANDDCKFTPKTAR